VKTSGNHLIDTNGEILQLRGVNVSGFEYFSVQGYDASQTLATQTGSANPWAAIKSWGANAVRLPLNETSWNANNSASVTCKDNGTTYHPDPNGNYRTSVKAAVNAATSAGLYVILDLHWSSPGNSCALALNPIGNSPNTTTFWTSLANTFKSYPNVIFDVYNEPYADDAGDFGYTDNDQWSFWRDGGLLTQYVSSLGDQSVATYQGVGMQSLINTVRATGATNVIIVGVMSWGCDMSGALAHIPVDPLDQLAVSWHAYPATNDGNRTDSTPIQPMCGSAQLNTYAPAILAAGIPLLIGEVGDQMGNNAAPFLHILLPWADKNNVSYLAWTWDTWGPSDTNPYLISDGSGTPAPGFAAYVKSHLLCRATGATSCP